MISSNMPDPQINRTKFKLIVSLGSPPQSSTPNHSLTLEKSALGNQCVQWCTRDQFRSNRDQFIRFYSATQRWNSSTQLSAAYNLRTIQLVILGCDTVACTWFPGSVNRVLTTDAWMRGATDVNSLRSAIIGKWTKLGCHCDFQTEFADSKARPNSIVIADKNCSQKVVVVLAAHQQSRQISGAIVYWLEFMFFYFVW